MRLFTASSTTRAELCPGSEALPHVDRLREWSENGKGIHRFLERVPKVGQKTALGEIEDDDVRTVCTEIDLKRLPLDPNAYAQEVAFAYDVMTGKARELGRGLSRNYGELAPTEIAGTGDVVALESDDGVYVGDYKSGWQYEKNAPDLSKNRQFHYLAKASAAAWNRSSATIEVIRITEEGKAWKKSHGLGPFDLDQIGDDLKRIALRVIDERKQVAAGKQPTLVPGSHCTYCPAFTNCPEIRNQVRTVLALDGDAPALAAELNDDTALMLAERVTQVEQANKLAKEVLKIYATSRPIKLRNGWVYGPVSGTTRSIDGLVARKVVGRFLRDEQAASTLKMKTSQDAIKDLVRPAILASGGKLGATFDALLEEIDRAGGIITSRELTVKAHKARLGEGA